VPGDQAGFWAATPLSGLAQHVFLPIWARGLITFPILAAALAVLAPAAHAALEEAEQLLRRLSTEHVLPHQLAPTDPTGRTPGNSINVAAAAAIFIPFASGAQVGWLSRAYVLSIAVALLLKIAIIFRLRRPRKKPPVFTTPFNLRIGLKEIP